MRHRKCGADFFIISGGHCSIDNLCAGLSKVLGYCTNCISLRDQPEYKCVFLTPDPIIHTLPIHKISCASYKIKPHTVHGFIKTMTA